MCHHFRRKRDPLFFVSPRFGPRVQPKKSAARDRAVELRKRNYSIYEISENPQGGKPRARALAQADSARWKSRLAPQAALRRREHPQLTDGDERARAPRGTVDADAVPRDARECERESLEVDAIAAGVSGREGRRRDVDPDGILTHLHPQRREPAAVGELFPLLEDRLAKLLVGRKRVADPVLGALGSVVGVVLLSRVGGANGRRNAVANDGDTLIAAARRHRDESDRR